MFRSPYTYTIGWCSWLPCTYRSLLIASYPQIPLYLYHSFNSSTVYALPIYTSHTYLYNVTLPISTGWGTKKTIRLCICRRTCCTELGSPCCESLGCHLSMDISTGSGQSFRPLLRCLPRLFCTTSNPHR